MPIQNAKDRKLSQQAGGLPNVSGALLGLFQPIAMGLITKIVERFNVKEEVVTIHSRGVIQPLSAQQLNMKPEGQRLWKWLQVHCLPDLILKIDDRVTYDGMRFRVMAKSDYSRYGYLEYHLCEDYSDAAVS